MFPAYFRSLDLDAETLANRYYKDYGLALRGLIRHHQIGELIPSLRYFPEFGSNNVHSTLRPARL